MTTGEAATTQQQEVVAAAESGLCTCGCGRPATTPEGWAKPCKRRWADAGRPEGGPKPPMSSADRARRGQEEKARRAAERATMPLEDPHHEGPWLAPAGDRRLARARVRTAGLVRCVADDDKQGIARILYRVHGWDDWAALVVVLAECADPAKVATVATAGRASGTGERRVV